MKDLFILKILDLFAFLFSKQNINYDQVRLLLKVKLIQDRRKPGSMFRNIKLRKKDSNMFLISLIYFFFMGIVMLPIILVMSMKSMLIGSIMYFAILMSFVSYAIIIEFSLDFFSTSDQMILLSKPFGYREMNIAKSIHIFLYMAAVATAFGLPSLVCWAIQFNIFVSLIAYIFTILSIFFLLFCSSLMYGVILSKFSGERLKDTISMFQIISIIIIFIGTQLFVHTFDGWFTKLELTSISPLLYILPPTWFALPSYMAGTGFFSLTALSVVIAGILFTIFGYRYYLQHQAYFFEKNLSKMNIVNTKQRKRREPFALKFTQLIKDNLNRAFYKFSVIMLSRERRIKQAIYPLITMGFIYQILFLYSIIEEPEIVLVETNYFLFYYFVIFMVLLLSIYTNFSENHKASWLYYYLPLKSPGNIILGAKLAMLVSYQSILLLVIGFLYLIIWKFTIIPDMIIMLLNSLIIQFIYENLSKRVLPFSEAIKTGRNSAFQHFSYFLAVFVFTPLAGMIHYLIHDMLPVLTIPFIIIQLGALYFLLKNHYNIKWDEIE